MSASIKIVSLATVVVAIFACTPGDQTRMDTATGTVGASIDSASLRTSASAMTLDSATSRTLLLSGEWKVQELDMVPVTDTTRATLRFATDGKVSGSTTCNSYSGNYVLTGAQIQLTQVVSTKRACADSALRTQETKFLAALNGATGWSVSGDTTLTLTGAAGTTLKAKK